MTFIVVINATGSLQRTQGPSALEPKRYVLSVANSVLKPNRSIDVELDPKLEKEINESINHFVKYLFSKTVTAVQQPTKQHIVVEAASNSELLDTITQKNSQLEELRTDIEYLKNLGIPLVLWCPKCTGQHIDKPDYSVGWTNPPHRTHLCNWCGHKWRPYPIATFGVATLAKGV
jgi:hypothetical protein